MKGKEKKEEKIRKYEKKISTTKVTTEDFTAEM